MNAMKALMPIMIAVGFAACASGHTDPFGDDTPLVRDIDKHYGQLLQWAVRSKNMAVRELGSVSYGDFEAPLYCISYRPSGNPAARPILLIDAAVHGDEPAGAAFVSGLVAGLARGSHSLDTYNMDIIPLVNPWGWSHDIRFNKEGIDINRDFNSPRSQEAKIILGFLKNKKYDLVLDLHEDPEASGVYFYQYARENKSLLTELVSRVQSSGYVIENDINMILLKTRNGIIDAPMWGLWYVKLTDQLSMSNYCRMNVSDNVFTLETPTTIPLEKRVFVHREAVVFLTGSLLNNNNKE